MSTWKVLCIALATLLVACGDGAAEAGSTIDELREDGIYRIKERKELPVDTWIEDEVLRYAEIDRTTKSVASEQLPEDFWMEIQPYTLELEEDDHVSIEVDGVDEIHTIVAHDDSRQFFTTEYSFTAASTGTYVLIVFPLHLSRWRDAIDYDIIARTSR